MPTPALRVSLLADAIQEAGRKASSGEPLFFDRFNLERVIVAALLRAEAPPPEGWQPMETAPKNGTVILGAEWVDGDWLTPPQSEPARNLCLCWWWEGDELNLP